MTPFFKHLVGRHEAAVGSSAGQLSVREPSVQRPSARSASVRPRLLGRFESGALSAGAGAGAFGAAAGAAAVGSGLGAWGELAAGEGGDAEAGAGTGPGGDLGFGPDGGSRMGRGEHGGPDEWSRGEEAVGASLWDAERQRYRTSIAAVGDFAVDRGGVMDGGRRDVEGDEDGGDDIGSGKEFGATGREVVLDRGAGSTMRPTASLDGAGAGYVKPGSGLEELSIKASAERLSRVGRIEHGSGLGGDAELRRIRPGQGAASRLPAAAVAEPAPTIKVTIGRIEVRAGGAPAVPENRKPLAPQKKLRMPLDEFLKSKKDPA